MKEKSSKKDRIAKLEAELEGLKKDLAYVICLKGGQHSIVLKERPDTFRYHNKICTKCGKYLGMHPGP